MQVPVRVHDACFTSGALPFQFARLFLCSGSPRNACLCACLPYTQQTRRAFHAAVAAAAYQNIIGDTRACAEVLGSLKCDCAEQLDLAMDYIQEKGTGIIIYLQQEGRGIGLANKIAAYALQVLPLADKVEIGRAGSVHAWPCTKDQGSTAKVCLQEEGLDTVDANRALGLPDDCREYTSVRNILQELNVESIYLMVCGGRRGSPPKLLLYSPCKSCAARPIFACRASSHA